MVEVLATGTSPWDEPFSNVPLTLHKALRLACEHATVQRTPAFAGSGAQDANERDDPPQ